MEKKTIHEKSETGCCPKFNPEPWDEKEIKWGNKLFLKDHVRCFFHIPLNFGKVIVRNMAKIKEANAFIPEPLVLSDESSLWRSEMYITISQEVPETKMEKISGTFLTKVFEGSYKNMRNWIKEMKKFVESKGQYLEKLYFYYTTCPKCAKFYGKNYTVILAKIKK